MLSFMVLQFCEDQIKDVKIGSINYNAVPLKHDIIVACHFKFDAKGNTAIFSRLSLVPSSPNVLL